MLVIVLAQDVAVVLVCRGSAELSQEQGESHGAMGGQDRVNWALLSSVSSQAGPMVSHPSQSFCQHLKGSPRPRRRDGAIMFPGRQQLLHLLTNKVWFWGATDEADWSLASEPAGGG